MNVSSPMQGSRDGREPIVATGFGLVTCLGIGARANWDALVARRCGFAPVTSFDTSGSAVKDGGEPPPLPPDRLAEFPPDLAPLAWLVESCREALAMAGGAPGADETRCGLVVGTSMAAAGPSVRFFESWIAGGPERADYAALEGYYAEDHLARLAASLGFRGPSLLVSNACAAGANAIARGADLLCAGRCDAVLAAGYDALSPFTHAGFGSLKALSPGRVRPFGRGRDGMKLGAGFAAILLERRGHAAARARAALAGWGESADAHHLTHPHPDGLGAALAMRRALARARIGPDGIDYINCHGTATPSNDRSETRALRAVFGDRLASIPLNASKPNFGHTLGGAGTVEAVVTLLVLERQFIPPSRDAGDIDPELSGLDLVPEGRPGRVRRGMSNSFGFGGCNASIVFEAIGGAA